MNALVLAAGLGTRLLPLTDRKSKVALSLAGIPVIVRVVRMLRRHGVDRIVVNLHHAPATVQAALAEAGEEVAYSPEPEILGTGGALRGAREHLAGSSFLLVNGDCYHEDPDLEGAVEFHRRKGAMATMLLLDMPGGEAYRPVELDNQSRILRVAGKPQSSSMKEAASLHFPGIHIFEPEVLDLVRPGFSDVNGTLYPRLIESGLPVFGYHTDFRWFDLGTPARFLEAACVLLQESGSKYGKGVLAGPGCEIAPDAVLRGPVELGRDCRVGAGCRLNKVVAGNGVRFGGGNTVANSLIGDGVSLGKGIDIENGFVCSVGDQLREEPL